MSRVERVYTAEEADNTVASFDANNFDNTDSDNDYLVPEFAVQQVSRRL